MARTQRNAHDMSSRVTVTADDYGLTRTITDRILELYDRGSISRVSLLANGLAFEYAAEMFRACAHKPELALHLNLTEGKALSRPEDVPHLVHPDGSFRYSPIKLLLRSLVPWGRSVFRAELRAEIEAQIVRVKQKEGGVPLFLDGHQHAHMVPLVFAEICSLHPQYRFAGVRLPREPFLSIPLGRLFSVGGWIRHFSLYALALLNQRKARKARMSYPDAFVGAFASGSLSLDEVRCGLAGAARAGAQSVEIGVHPGVPESGELGNWNGDVPWHLRRGRAQEREMISGEGFRRLVAEYPHIVYRGVTIAQIARFGIGGTTAAAVHVGLLFALTEYVGLWYLYSVVAGWGAALVVNFTLQKYWTFGERTQSFFSHQIALYTVMQVASVLINTSLMYVAVDILYQPYVLSQVVIILFLACLTFLVSQRVIFHAPSPV
jgi:predicted glycoside hydrolase/deacetylase ChbG (UPF0249 family)/putative flippase GtrA